MKNHSLKRQEDFREVYQKGKLVFGRYVAVHLLPIPDGETKIGLSVSKKVGNAVTRNAVKRKLREIVRELYTALPLKHYIVIGCKANASRATYWQLKDDLSRIIKGLEMT